MNTSPSPSPSNELYYMDNVKMVDKTKFQGIVQRKGSEEIIDHMIRAYILYTANTFLMLAKDQYTCYQIWKDICDKRFEKYKNLDQEEILKAIHTEIRKNRQTKAICIERQSKMALCLEYILKALKSVLYVNEKGKHLTNMNAQKLSDLKDGVNLSFKSLTAYEKTFFQAIKGHNLYDLYIAIDWDSLLSLDVTSSDINKKHTITCIRLLSELLADRYEKDRYTDNIDVLLSTMPRAEAAWTTIRNITDTLINTENQELDTIYLEKIEYRIQGELSIATRSEAIITQFHDKLDDMDRAKKLYTKILNVVNNIRRAYIPQMCIPNTRDIFIPISHPTVDNKQEYIQNQLLKLQQLGEELQGIRLNLISVKDREFFNIYKEVHPDLFIK